MFDKFSLAWNIQVVFQREMELPFKSFKVQFLCCFRRGPGSVSGSEGWFSPLQLPESTPVEWPRWGSGARTRAPGPEAREGHVEQQFRSCSLLGLSEPLKTSAALNPVPLAPHSSHSSPGLPSTLWVLHSYLPKGQRNSCSTDRT